MPSASGQRAIARVWFYVAAIALVVVVWRIQSHMNSVLFPPDTVLSASPTNALPTVSDWQKMSIQAVSQTNSLLITLGTALLGALGLLMDNSSRGGSRPRHLWAAFLGALGAGLSLYYGYVSHLNLLVMISNQNFDPYSQIYLFPSHAQFYTLLAGAFFFADFAVHDLSKEA